MRINNHNLHDGSCDPPPPSFRSYCLRPSPVFSPPPPTPTPKPFPHPSYRQLLNAITMCAGATSCSSCSTGSYSAAAGWLDHTSWPHWSKLGLVLRVVRALVGAMVHPAGGAARDSGARIRPGFSRVCARCGAGATASPSPGRRRYIVHALQPRLFLWFARLALSLFGVLDHLIP